MSNHTPGPWKLETESRHPEGSEVLVTDADGEFNIADCCSAQNASLNLAPPYSQAVANARLIIAAPELLEVVKGLIHLASYLKCDNGVNDGQGHNEGDTWLASLLDDAEAAVAIAESAKCEVTR